MDQFDVTHQVGLLHEWIAADGTDVSFLGGVEGNGDLPEAEKNEYEPLDTYGHTHVSIPCGLPLFGESYTHPRALAKWQLAPACLPQK